MKPRELLVIALVAASISIPISLWAYEHSYGVGHDGLLMTLCIPILIVAALCGPNACGSEWVLNTLALLAQFLGYFSVVFMASRLIRKSNRNNS